MAGPWEQFQPAQDASAPQGGAFDDSAYPAASPAAPTVTPGSAPLNLAPSLPAAAGPWTQFAPSASAEPLADYPPAPTQPAAPPQKPGGIALNLAAGANTGIANMLGAPMEISNGIRNLAVRGINAVAGTSIPLTDTIGGAADAKRAMGMIGANPDDVSANTTTEKLVRAGAEGATMALAPEAAGSALVGTGLASAARVAPVVERLGAITPGNVAAGAGAGIGSETAASLVPDEWKPIAGMAGGLLGGAAVAVPVAATQATRNGLIDLGQGLGLGSRNALMDTAGQPIADAAGKPIVVTAPQAQAAGARIEAAASNPDAVRQALETPTVTTLPASPATTFQATGDTGLGDLERGISQTDNRPFLDLQNQQNAARVAARDAIVPPSANSADAGAAFQRQRAALGASDQAAVDQARSGLGGALDRLGGAVTGTDSATALQQFGQRLRGVLDTAAQDSKASVSDLYDAIDPDGTLAVNMQPAREAAQAIKAGMPQNAAPLAGEEAAIFQTMGGLPDAQSYRELGALNSRVTTAMRAARSDPAQAQTYARLSQLRAGLADVLQSTAEGKAASDAVAVRAGTMASEASMLSRIQAHLQSQKQDFLARQTTRVADAGTGTDGNLGGYPGAPPADVYSGGGGASQARSRPGNAPGNPGLPGSQSLIPNADQAAADRITAANTAYAQHKGTYGPRVPGVGPILAPGPTAGTYALPDSQVMGQLVRGGAGTAERVQSFLRAGGQASDLADAAGYSFRQAAENPDGTLNAAKAARWQQAHAELLTALPDFHGRLTTATGAQDALDSAAAQQTATRRAYETSAAGKFLGDADPAKQIAAILGSNNAQAQARQLAALAASDPAARVGLQRAVVDHLATQMQGDRLAGQTGTTQVAGAGLQKFIRQKGPALSEIMTPQQMRVLQDIAADIQQSDLSSGTVIRNGSPTAQNLAAASRVSAGGTLLDHVRRYGMETLVGGGSGAAVGGSVGGALFGVPGSIVGGSIGTTVGTLAGKVTSSLKAANIATVDGLVKEAMLNPGLARVLLARVTPQTAPNVGQALVTTLRRSAVSGVVSGAGATDTRGNRSAAPLNALATLGAR